MLAAWKGHVAVCEFLVEQGADVHAQDDVRNLNYLLYLLFNSSNHFIIPASLTSRFRSPCVFAFDSMHKNTFTCCIVQDGDTALDIAIHWKHKDVADYVAKVLRGTAV